MVAEFMDDDVADQLLQRDVAGGRYGPASQVVDEWATQLIRRIEV